MRSRYLSNPDVNTAYGRGHLHYAIQTYRHCDGGAFQAALPSGRFKAIVSYYHQVHVSKQASCQTIYPTGNTALVFRFDDHSPQAFLVGTPTMPLEAGYVTFGCDYFVVLFWPGMGHAFCPIPAAELIDRYFLLDEVFPGHSERVVERMMSARGFAERVRIIEHFFEGMLLPPDIPWQLPSFAPKACRKADSRKGWEWKGYTERHMRRLFQRYLGVSPKFFSRIMRHQRTLKILNSKPVQDMAGLAFELGYYDQAHFIKEFKRFQGATPARFVGEFSCNAPETAPDFTA